MNLKRHMKEHHENKNFQCNHCEKVFKTKSVLEKHIERVHKPKNIAEIRENSDNPDMESVEFWKANYWSLSNELQKVIEKHNEQVNENKKLREENAELKSEITKLKS